MNRIGEYIQLSVSYIQWIVVQFSPSIMEVLVFPLDTILLAFTNISSLLLLYLQEGGQRRLNKGSKEQLQLLVTI